MTTTLPERPALQTDRAPGTRILAEARRTADPAVGGAARVARQLISPEALLLGVTLLLTVFGLVMQFAATSVETRDNPLSFAKQAMYALVGVPLMLIAARLPERFWARVAAWGVLLGLVLQLLVFTPLGMNINGNRNWLDLKVATLQPSEFLKLALAVWLGYLLARKGSAVRTFRGAWMPAAIVAGIAILLVLLGHDFGTVVIMVGLLFGALFFAGAKLLHLILPLIAAGLVAIPVIFASETRVRRIGEFLRGCTEAEYYDGCWQQLHGTWAVSSGGVFGVGLGNSRAKWNWLPEADSDYIFAIVGEELGLIGAVGLLALYMLMAFAFLGIIRRTNSAFTRITTGAVMVWVIGQAIVNIAVVLGLLPVLGVPLPLVSRGGSQTIATLLAIGVVLALARADRLGERSKDVKIAVRAEASA